MHGAGPESPASGRPVGLMEQIDLRSRTTRADFIAVIGSVLAHFAETQAFDQKPLFFGDLPHRKGGRVETYRRGLLRDLAQVPPLAGIAVVLHHFESQTRGMLHVDV